MLCLKTAFTYINVRLCLTNLLLTWCVKRRTLLLVRSYIKLSWIVVTLFIGNPSLTLPLLRAGNTHLSLDKGRTEDGLLIE